MVFSEYMQSLPVVEYRAKAKELREECRIDNTTLWRWIYKQRTPSPLYRKEIARVLQMEENDLFPQTV